MKLTVLGNSSPYPAPGGACSGYLITGEYTTILLECGTGVIGKLHKYLRSWNLDAVVISHLHPDHCGDLPALKYAVRTGMFYNYRNEKLPVYITKNPQDKLPNIKEYKSYLNFNFYEDINTANGIKVKIKEFYLHFIKMTHSLPAYGVHITDGKRNFVFSSDTRYTSDLISHFYKADLLLCEATALERDGDNVKKTHLSTVQAGEIARKAEVKKFLPTHFFPEYSLETIKKEIEKGYENPVELSVLDKTYEI